MSSGRLGAVRYRRLNKDFNRNRGLMSADDPINANEQANSTGAKKPYEKPSFRYEKVFVTSALSCGKTPNSIQGQCGVNPKVS